jgi:hypothetical protein
MDAEISQARQTRARYRHELRTLTYVTLDQANGGVVRNLTRYGMGLQVVAAVRPRQQLRVRFELRYPRVRVEARGEVVWATFSGQCGIRFLDLSPSLARQIQQWIFGDLLEGISLHAQHPGSIFWGSGAGNDEESVEEDDGLLVSPQSRNVIELPEPATSAAPVEPQGFAATELDWLSQPLSGQSLAWTINALVLMAGVLLFVLVFLSVTRQAPSWPVALSGASLVVGMYWGFFQLFGGSSLGTRLARRVASDEEDSEEDRDARFR